MIPIFEEPNAQRVVTLEYWQGFFRSVAGVLNRLRSHNFNNALGGLTAAKRSHRYSLATYNYTCYSGAPTGRIIHDAPVADGELRHFAAEVPPGLLSAGQSITLALYRDTGAGGVLIDALVLDDSTSADSFSMGAGTVYGQKAITGGNDTIYVVASSVGLAGVIPAQIIHLSVTLEALYELT